MTSTHYLIEFRSIKLSHSSPLRSTSSQNKRKISAIELLSLEAIRLYVELQSKVRELDIVYKI